MYVWRRTSRPVLASLATTRLSTALAAVATLGRSVQSTTLTSRSRSPTPDSLSGIPEYLRIAAKPVVDVILSGGNPNETPRQELLNQFGGLMYEDIDYIGSVLETCTCEKSGHLKRNEPYASLEANLPPPPKPSRFHKTPSRRDRLQAGTGLLLRDMVPIQAKLGACECRGRRKTEE